MGWRCTAMPRKGREENVNILKPNSRQNSTSLSSPSSFPTPLPIYPSISCPFFPSLPHYPAHPSLSSLSLTFIFISFTFRSSSSSLFHLTSSFLRHQSHLTPSLIVTITQLLFLLFSSSFFLTFFS